MGENLQDAWAEKAHGISYADWQNLCDAVADAMIKYGPDHHTDGYEYIAEAAVRSLRECGWRRG